MNSVKYVLDASALLALVHRERGWALVEKCLLEGAVVISAVNYCEVVGKCIELGKPLDALDRLLTELGVQIVDFSRPMALEAGKAKSGLASFGLSLGDRACLTLARMLSAQAITADAAWQKLSPDYRVISIR